MTTANPEIDNPPEDIAARAQAPFPRDLANVLPGEQKSSKKQIENTAGDLDRLADRVKSKIDGYALIGKEPPNGKSQPSKTTTVIAKVTKTPTLPGESAIDPARIDKAVHKINNIHQNGALKTATAIGEYLLKAFFGGDLHAFKAKEKKHASFRALSERDDLAIGHTALWYSIAVLDQLRQLPSEIGSALPMSHHRLLIPVKDMETKLKLATEAVEGGLTKAAFERLVRENRVAGAKEDGDDQKRGGRPALPGWARGIGGIKAAVVAACEGDGIVIADERLRAMADARLAEVTEAILALEDLKGRLEMALAD